jgi:endonuclease VIII
MPCAPQAFIPPRAGCGFVPEGDTVWLAARRMHGALGGQVLTRTDFRVPASATLDLSGRRVLGVASRGKHMLTRVEGDITVHTHFMLAGEWHLYRAGTTRRGGPWHEIRVELRTGAWHAIGYRLGVVDVLDTAREAEVVGHLGPDLLGEDWDEAKALARLAAAPDREIGEALCDQRNLAGIGNLYKTEALFLSGITPWVPVGDIADLAGLVRRARRLMLANREHPEQTTTGNLRAGHDHWVFQRPGRPCRRCADPIRRAWQGTAPRARLCYWCPGCQAGPAPEAASSPRDTKPA